MIKIVAKPDIAQRKQAAKRFVLVVLFQFGFLVGSFSKFEGVIADTLIFSDPGIISS